VRLFHYHLVTSEIVNVEARYVGKLGFHLVARYGRVDDEHVSVAGGEWLQARLLPVLARMGAPHYEETDRTDR